MITPAFPEIVNENFYCEAKLHGVSVLQSGMTTGKTSVGIAIELPDGKYVLVQTSASMIEGIFAAIRGAEQRWHDEQATHN